MSGGLNQEDVKRLMADSSPSARAELAGKVASLYDDTQLKAKERQLAEEILRVLVNDQDTTVRQTLAEHLKDAQGLPHDIALALIKVSDEPALSMLRYSSALRDEDLIPLIPGANEEYRLAIARRSSLSSGLVNALIADSGEAVVLRVLGNDRAEIDELAVDRLLAEHGQTSWVLDLLASRSNLPATGARRLLRMIIERLEAAFKRGDILTLDDLSDAILAIRQVCVASGGLQLVNGDMDDLIALLHGSERLEPSLLLRTLCLGDFQFFDLAMARLAGIPIKKAHRLIHDKGTLGLETIFLRTGLPEDFLPAVQIAVEVAIETKYEGLTANRGQYVQRLLERLLNEFDNPGEKIPADDIEYLLDKLQRTAA